MNIKISVAIPTYNESLTIEKLLDALLNQSLPPDEILISDGGSTDSTVQIIINYITHNKKIKLVGRSGLCRGAGRNSAISAAKNAYVALIDAGTIPEKDWLEKLVEPIFSDPCCQVVYGVAKPLYYNTFTKCLSSIILGRGHKTDYVTPTVASILINKIFWNNVGKFPESIDGSYLVEDLIFIERIKCQGEYTHNALDASVSWSLSPDIKSLFHRTTTYSRGGIKAGFAKIWHYGLFRNICATILIMLAGLLYNHVLLLFIPLLQFIRAYVYIANASWYINDNIFRKIYYLSLSAYILLIVDAASINGFFKWVFIDKRAKTY